MSFFIPTICIVFIYVTGLVWPEMKKKNWIGYNAILITLMGWQAYKYIENLDYSSLVNISWFSFAIILWIATSLLAIFGRETWSTIISTIFAIVSGAILITGIAILGFSNSLQIIRWITIPAVVFFTAVTLYVAYKGIKNAATTS